MGYGERDGCLKRISRFPDDFAPVEAEYIQQWDEDVKTGKMFIVEFPDFSHLYLRAGFTEQDRTYLANLFWQQRWYRYWLKIAPYMAAAFGPPTALLLFGLSVGWVRRGFARKILP